MIMDRPLLKTEQLTRIFQSEEVRTTAVRALNLQIKQGEFVAVMGPSGCGKSTLLHLLGLIDRLTSGTYQFDGTDCHHLSENQMTRIRREHVGFIFQHNNLVEELTIQENVELPLFFAGFRRKERRSRVKEILQRLRMEHRASHYPSQLSGGQQQRVAFARALVNEPKLLLADEPTGNLDSRNGTAILDLMEEHNQRGGSIIMVTHSLKDASYAHRIVHMQDGQQIYPEA